MLDRKVKYGISSTYEILSLRQTIVGQKWGLEISAIIRHTNMFTHTSVRLRQCFFDVALTSLMNPGFDQATGLRSQAWTESEGGKSLFVNMAVRTFFLNKKILGSNIHMERVRK